MQDSNIGDGKELKEEELAKVAGGQLKAIQDGKYYKWKGAEGAYDVSWDHAYLCPRCGRKLHWDWCRYWCDPCDESWYYESKLKLNLEDGYWKEVTESEYKLNDHDCPPPGWVC